MTSTFIARAIAKPSQQGSQIDRKTIPRTRSRSLWLKSFMNVTLGRQL